MRLYGLIGRSLGHSFSQRYFREKFAREAIANVDYRNFELDSIAEFPRLFEEHPEVAGLNVTIPYKRAVIPALNYVDPVARVLGAVSRSVADPALSLNCSGDSSTSGV